MTRRTVKKQVWLSPEEAQELRSKAERTGLTEAAVVRLLIRNFRPKEKPGREFYETMRKLDGISSNLNQLAARANALGFADGPEILKEREKWDRFRSDVRARYLQPERETIPWQ